MEADRGKNNTQKKEIIVNKFFIKFRFVFNSIIRDIS